jgi:O-acetylserine/cysteine efflux transporter
MPFADALALLFVAFVWGFNFVVIAIGLDSYPPLFFSALRFLICALPAVFVLPRPAVSTMRLVALGLVLGVLLFGFLFLGIRAGTPPGLASLLMQAQAFMTVALGAACLKARPSPVNWAALAIGLAGLALIAAERGRSGSVGAMALVLAAALSWATANIMMVRMPRINMLHFMAWMSLVPPLPLLALSLATEGSEAILSALAGSSPVSIGAVVYTGLVSTLGGYGIWGTMLQRHSPAAVAPFALLVPVFGLASAALVLGERLERSEAIGSLLVILALAVNVWEAPLRGLVRRSHRLLRPRSGPGEAARAAPRRLVDDRVFPR